MHIADVADYLEEIAQKLEETGGAFTEGPTIELNERETAASLELSIEYSDGSRLEVTLTVVAGDHPDWTDYSFHYMDRDDRCIFRYDNTPHYHGHSFFPHHKHAGFRERAADHPRPSVAHIVREILAHQAGPAQ